MTTQRKLELAAAVVVVLVAGVFARGWYLERQARATAEARTAADDRTIAAAASSIQTRDAAAAKTDAALAKQSAAIATPAQAAAVIQGHFTPPALGKVAAPVETVLRAELPADVQAKLPDAPSYEVLTDMQAEDIARNDLSCDIAKNDLATCKADFADQAKEVAAAKDEAQAWKAAAKGGTRWQRLERVLKLTGCAAGGAAAGHYAAKGNPLGPAIGAAAGVTGCSLF